MKKLLILAFVFSSCGGATGVRHTTDPVKPKKPGVPLEPVLHLKPGAAGGSFIESPEGMLAAVRENRRNPTGAVERITGMQWREKTFGPEALDDALSIRARSYFPGADAAKVPDERQFEEKYGVSQKELWQALMAGYRKQFENLYGIQVSNIDLVRLKPKAGHAVTLAMSGYLPGEGYRVSWQAGHFMLSGPSKPGNRPARALPREPPADRTVENVVISRGGDYYAYPDLSWSQLRLPATGKEKKSRKMFIGEVRRAHVESASYVTESGRSLKTIFVAERWTKSFILRPGGWPGSGLKNEVHLVRAVLDGSALPGSIVITKSLKVLDGTGECPMHLQTVYRAAQRRSQAAWQTALTGLQKRIKKIAAEFAEQSKQWSQGLNPPGGRLESSSREFFKAMPRFEWDGQAGTMTIRISYEKQVIYKSAYWYPNPALKNFHCPPGVPCALPPREVSKNKEQRTRIGLLVTTVFDRSGALVSESAGQPGLDVQR